jgi:hypothetical protein
MKTASEWFQHLPEPIKTRAMSQTIKDKDEKYESLSMAIISAFNWGRSSYWVRVHDYYEQLDQRKGFSRWWFKLTHKAPK